MASQMLQSKSDQRAFSYLVGINVSHSVAPPMHDFVAKSLRYDWEFKAQECSSVQDVIELFKKPTFAGGVVTMPYKMSIMEHLDGLDDYAILLKACNNVYRDSDGALRGTNTDWRGIKGCLQSATLSTDSDNARGRPALLIGAGGAARAAVYVLHREMECHPIYIVNRDRGEVENLMEDSRDYGEDIKLLYLDSVQQAAILQSTHGCPFYIIGTVPDFEPTTPQEIECKNILEFFLSHETTLTPKGGVLLDMCFKPRNTSNIQLAKKYGWRTVDGIGIIGYQIQEQYRLWLGESHSPITPIIQQGAFEILNDAADKSSAING